MTDTVSSRDILSLLVQREKFRQVSWPVRMAMRRHVFSLYGVDKQGTAATTEDENLVPRHPDFRNYCMAMLSNLERKLEKDPWSVEMFLRLIMIQED